MSIILKCPLKEQVKQVKCTLVQALRLCTGCTAHRGSRGIALLFHDKERPGRDLDHPSPSSAEVKERVELYLGGLF